MKKSRKRSGQGLVEYVLLVALLALVSVIALTNMGATVNQGLFTNISTNLSTAESSIKTAP